MSAKEPTGTRSYHPTNMTRRDHVSQSILNRIKGVTVEDEQSATLPEMNPETAHHFSKASEAMKRITDEIVPSLVRKISELETSQKQAEELAIKRDGEMNAKFDAIMAAIGGAAKASNKKSSAKSKPVEDFQDEAEDDLPPAEK